MLKTISLSFITSIVVVIIALYVHANFFNKTPRIGVVKTYQLLEKYKGMQEVKVQYQTQYNQWQSNLDTLKLDYQKAVSKYSVDVSSLTEGEKRERESLLKQQNQNLVDYAHMLDDKAKEEEQKLTQGVLAQVDAYLKEYAKENKYDVVFGTSSSENVLYSEDYYDITDNVLTALNEDYVSTAK